MASNLDTLNSLQIHVEAAEKIIKGNTKALSNLKQKKNAFVTASVTGLLPDLTKKVFENLSLTIPKFVDGEVTRLFEANFKILGIFKKSRHQAVLNKLGIRIS